MLSKRCWMACSCMNNYKIIDISMPMDKFVFPSNPPWNLEGPFNRVSGDNPEYVYDFKLCTQSGTHIQGPHYFLEDGKKISDYPLNVFEGEAHIFESEKRGIDIERNELEAALSEIDLQDKIFIIKTGHMKELIECKELVDSHRPGLSLKGAKYLCEEKKIRMIVIDSVGVESRQSEDHDVNVYLCQQGILILECVCHLELIGSGRLWLEAFPLSIDDVEGTPCRAIIKETINEEEA